MPRRPDMEPLRRADLDPDPIAQFGLWFEAAEAEAPLAEAMTLATVDADGAPDARMVLLKGWDERGFRFFTNRESAKGQQLGASPRAALILYWRELDRQVRIRGAVEPLSDEESDEYFASRPRPSQLGAWASPQSRSLADRAELDARLAEIEARYGGGGEVPRPQHWGGFRVAPELIEFWQGQVGRLHDRFLYRRSGEEDWSIERLAP
jgi:pyridoxamine 5'-phosphate oxidase